MILVDTSVWIDFFKGNETVAVSKLEFFISEDIDLCINGIILTEVLQGIKFDKDYKRTEEYFRELIELPLQRSTFVLASQIFRKLRKKGITIRKTMDCIIAANAIEQDVHLLHNDKDFLPVETHFKLKILPS